MKDREALVYLLREVASTIQVGSDTLIIRLAPHGTGWPPEERATLLARALPEERTTVFATALPEHTEGTADRPSTYKHIRWQMRSEFDRTQAGSAALPSSHEEEMQYYSKDSIKASEADHKFSWTNPPDFFTKVPNIRSKIQQKQKQKKSREDAIRSRVIRNNDQASYRTNFKFCCGNPEGAAIFSTAKKTDQISEFMTVETITALFSLGHVNIEQFLEHLYTQTLVRIINSQEVPTLSGHMDLSSSIGPVFSLWGLYSL